MKVKQNLQGNGTNYVIGESLEYHGQLCKSLNADYRMGGELLLKSSEWENGLIQTILVMSSMRRCKDKSNIGERSQH